MTYLSGYIRSHKKANPANTTATLLTSRLSKSFVKKYDAISRLSGCHSLCDLNMLKLHIVDLSNLEIEGLDSYFLSAYAPNDFLHELAALFSQKRGKPMGRKLLDKLREMLYIRIRSFENEADWRELMPVTYEADITDMVKPYYEQGIEKGKLEAAKGMLDAGADVDFVCKATGLRRKQLKEAGLLK